MRCKSCDYPLWNIKARQCPECGTSFAPSQYDFVINSVQFCCPQCEQAYYGTGVKGHLVPREFHCVTCGQLVHMDLMLLRPAQGVSEDQTQIDRMPWLERKQRGFIKAWFQTMWKSMFDPVSLMRGVPAEDRIGNAWVYAIVTLVLLLLCGAGIPLAALGAIAYFFGGGPGVEMLLTGATLVFGGTVGFLLLIVIWGAIAHGILRATGGATYTIGRTYQALLYSVGANAPLATPCLSVYCMPFTWIWWSISGTLMLAHGQRVNAGRAAAAVFAFPAVSCVVGMIVLVGGMMWTGLRAGRQPSTTPTISEVNTFTSAIVNYATVNNGRGPSHALELVNSAGLGTQNFVSMNTATDTTRIPVGETTLNQIDYLPANRQQMAIQAAADGLPINVIAHRCGDFVFTYHGLDFRNCNPNLWIVILWPDPDFNSGSANAGSTHVGLASGTPRRLVGPFAIHLAQQNQLRAMYNLPPLPDPAAITHRRPATAPSQ